MVMKNKRGEGMSMTGTLGAIVLIVFLIVAVGYWFVKTQGEGAGTIGVISVSANGIAIESCNAYCDYINGEQVSGIGGVTISGRDDAIYSYCVESQSFLKENNQRISMNCSFAAAYGGGKLGIRTSGCKELCVK